MQYHKLVRQRLCLNLTTSSLFAESFANVTTWLDHISKHAPPNCGLITMVIGNKTDLA
jgi:Ras family